MAQTPLEEALEGLKPIPYELPGNLMQYTQVFEPLGMLMLHHKFYVGIVFPYLVNGQPSPEEAIVEKSQRAREALEGGDFDHYIWLHERPYRAFALQDIMDSDIPVSEGKMGALCRSVWTDSENIHQNLDIWGRMFEVVPGSDWMTDDDHDSWDDLPDTFRIWRGVCDDGDVSWSRSEPVARFFANRGIHNSTGEVITQVVRKSDIFAYTDARNEQEVLLLP